MSWSHFVERVLRGLARRDPTDCWKKPLLLSTGAFKALQGKPSAAKRYLAYAGLTRGVDLAAHRERLEDPRYFEKLEDSNHETYLSSCVKLVQYAFPDWSSSICDVGCGRGLFLRALETHGYTNCEGFDISKSAVENAVHPAVRHTETLTQVERDYDLVCLISVLEHIAPADLDAFVAEVARIARNRVVACLPIYPQNMLDFFDRDPTHLVLERREWWDHLFARYGFEPQTVREPLPFVVPFVYRRVASPLRTPKPAEREKSPQFVAALPPHENAFRWVCEALVAAAEQESVPAKVLLPNDWEQGTRQAKCTLTWAHYWQPYREAARKLQSDQECFVTNFSFESRGHLTPWLDELCSRPSRKITPSHFAKEELVKLGVPADHIQVVPHGYSPEFAKPLRALPLATRKTFRFLAVVNSADPYRYGFDLLMAAYRKAFRAGDDVSLVVKDYGVTSEVTKALLNKADGPEVLYYANFMPKDDLAALYASASAFVAPFRGEGFGMKIMDAAAAGLPLILPVYGGPRDYCPPDLVYATEHTLQPVGRCLETDQLTWNEGLTWCEVDVDHLASQMRHVYENTAEAGNRASKLRKSVIENFSWRSAARTLIRWMDLS